MGTETEMLSLARYHVWAGIMRHSLEQSLKRDDAVNPDGSPGVTTFAMMSYWYGALYVVVEGWQALQLSDATIDELLSDNEKVQNLKLYRNATFHYQKELYHEKFLRLMRGEEKTAEWVQALHHAFERFFSEWATAAGYLNDEVLKEYEEWRQQHPLARSGPP